MFSRSSKILFKILGKPMIQFVVDIAHSVNSDEIIVVVGKDGREIKKILGPEIKYATQTVPKGTGDATRVGIDIAKNPYILILYGDVPLLKKETIEAMIANHFNQNADLSVLTCLVSDPSGYGRIIRDRRGNLIKIIEQVDASEKELKVREINTGIYFGARKIIQDELINLKPDNKQGELYLTDIVHNLIKKKKNVLGFKITDEEEILGVNTKFDLARIQEIAKKRWFKELMLKGVYIEDPQTTHIDLTVKFGNYVHIRPFTMIEGNTFIKDDSVIGPFTWIKDGKKKVLK
jgi:bifunctional UDP-N-acetylglucosamine pyrophosphorylase/glucosamine-1-phosphate N-acetyltransferase